MSVRSVQWMKLTAQKTHDSQILPDLEQLKGSLFLFDLGYFSHIFLYKLNEIGVWFVCRLKANSVPIITRVVKGVAKRYIGCPLNKNVTLRGSIVEVWANLGASPQLECWNNGIMGFGQMGQRLIGKIPIDSEVHKRVSFP